MKVTWLIPNTLPFLLDELTLLSEKSVTIRVLTSKPVSREVSNRLPSVLFLECPEASTIRSINYFDPLRRLHPWRRLLTNNWQIRKIAGIYDSLRKLESNDPSDIIHSHFAHPAGVGGALIPDTPQVLTLRGYDILTTGNYGALWNSFFRESLIKSYSHSGVITVGSEFSQTRARQILGQNADVRYLREGVTSDEFNPANKLTRSSAGIPDDAFLLLAVGNFVEVKNLHFLIDMFSELLKRSDRSLHLALCGTGPLESELKNEVDEKRLSDRIHFMGRLPRQSLTDVYHFSDLLLHPSMSEGFCSVVVEGCLMKLPVVANPVGIAPEIITHETNGYLPRFCDKADWIKCILSATAHYPTLSKAAKELSTRVGNDFNMKRRIEGYLKIYDELN